MGPDPDSTFVSRARDGDLGAFEILVERHRDVVYRVAARVLGEDEADDATQDALLRAFHRLDDFRGDGSFRAWLLQIAYHSPAGSSLEITYRVFGAGRLVAAGTPVATLARDGWFGVRLAFRPVAGRRYVVQVDAADVNGNRLSRTITVAGARLGVKTTLLPAI